MSLSRIGLLTAGVWMLGCVAPLSSPTAPPTISAAVPPLSISNGTTITVTLAINGVALETIEPGGYEDPVDVPLPALPWLVETRSPSGRVLSTMTVQAGDVVYTTPDASSRSSSRGDAVRVDLSCGRLDVWAGPPMLGPAFSPGPGSCD